MAKISMAKAAQVFAVSRPTILKHLQQGKITGEKTVQGKNTFWEIDESELARVYSRRDEVAPDLPGNITKGDTPAAPDLQAEINVLKARLEATEALAQERARHIEDLRKLLPGPGDRPQDRGPRRRWWPFRRG